jgi:hypothetical protein
LDVRESSLERAAPPDIDVRRIRTVEELEPYVDVTTRVFGSASPR